MRVAFVTNYDLSDMSAWSGSMYGMHRALRKSGVDLQTIDALTDPFGIFFKAKRVIKNAVFKKNYLRDREPVTLRWYAKQVKDRLNQINSDVVLSAGTIPIAYLRTNKPVVFWADATFDGMINFYPEFTNLCDETIRNGRRMEQAALSHCRLAIYSSEWAAKTARDNYEVDEGKIKVVPYGANIPDRLSADEIRCIIGSPASRICKLLFVGVDWERKGGDRALAVASILNQKGLRAELHVVGCDPPSPLPDYVKTYGYLSKSNREDASLLTMLYRRSDFFILPSRAECAAVSVAEANSFGLPALTTDVGGMKTVVRNGMNGQIFDSSSFVQECADYVVQILSSGEEFYRQLCFSSFEEHTNRLNWDSAVQSVLIRKLISVFFRAACTRLRKLRIFFYFDVPALVVGKMPMKLVHF